MFDKEFFPTPANIGNNMCGKTDIKDKIILEPHAGKGDLVDVIRLFCPKEIIICEKNHDLAKISSQKADRYLTDDVFKLTKEDISHVNVIVANPPFSNADKHILHLYDIMPDGCELLSLCNWETLNNVHSVHRSKLSTIISDYGYKENFGQCFSADDVERKTDVVVGFVHIFKPAKNDENEFENYFSTDEDYDYNNIEGILRYDEIVEIVNRYVGAVKYYDEVVDIQSKMNSLIAPISNYENGIVFKAVYTNSNKSYNTITREVFKKELQKSAWKELFKKFNIERFVTTNVLAKLNEFVETQTKYPFTVKNIYRMIDMIYGTRENTMNSVIVEVFDMLTSHSPENRYHHESWKTNSEYMVNKKFIVPYCGVYKGFNDEPCVKYDGAKKMNDLLKAICVITGENYDNKTSFHNFYGYYEEVKEAVETDITDNEAGYSYLDYKRVFEDGDYNKHHIHKRFKYIEDKRYTYRMNRGIVERCKQFGKVYEWTFFNVRVYKKGTLHCEFLDENVWNMFNHVAAKAKGYQLATDFTYKYRAKKGGIVKI